MACDITKGFLKSCKESLGGVSSIYVFNYVDEPFIVVDGEATDINPAVTEVYEYEVQGDGNILAENMVPDRNTFTTVNTQTITAILGGIDKDKSNELTLLAKGYPMAVVKDRNGNYFAVGIDDGIDFTVDDTTGGAKTDLNGYTLTGTSTVNALAPQLDEDTVTAFLLLVQTPV